MRHLGTLDHGDPFYGFLKEHIMPQVAGHIDQPQFTVHCLRGSNQVFLYTEEKSGVKVIGKFFYGQFERAWDVAAKYLTREWDGIQTLRYLGFNQAPHYVPAAFGRSYDINCALVEEYCPGTTFSEILQMGARGKHGKLFRRLTALAGFLARLHNMTARSHERVDFNIERHYGVTLVQNLTKRNVIPYHQVEALYRHIEQWACKEIMWQDNPVLLHGDATPANFLFRNHTDVVAIDLERVHYSDRLFDVGRIVGEIKHAFLLESDDPYYSEPFIGHFLWQYCMHFPDCPDAFYALSRRIPFYIATTLLRIARNSWVSDHHRKKLIDQAFLNFHYQG